MPRPTTSPITRQETDYVACFDALARVETEIRKRGASPHLLLRRAMLSMAIGNYVGALDAARNAVAATPREPEAHYQEGLAWLWLARVHVGQATIAPGSPMPTKRPLRLLLENALDCFSSASACADGDAEADGAAQWLDEMLELDDEQVVARLRAS